MIERDGHESARETPRVDATDETVAVPVGEERLVVGTRDVERTGTVKLRTREEEVPYSETLRHDRVEIERVPVDEIVDLAPAERQEGDVTVIPIVEEVLVKRFRVIEEVRLRRYVEVEEVSDTVTLRRQEAHVEEGDPAATT